MQNLILCPECQKILKLSQMQSCLSIVPGDQKCEVCARQDGLQEFGMSDERLNEISNAVRQIRFIYELMDGIRSDIVLKILAGKVPIAWSGIELRRLVADKTKAADYVRWTKKAEDDYANTVLVNNL